mmetsp:Transcript_18434/g.42692  ORF Transcript_18434/g.42692 Transcript_18434/m.42692 type:complete len:220 (+) Transcript_18434:1983-2642(+)
MFRRPLAQVDNHMPWALHLLGTCGCTKLRGRPWTPRVSGDTMRQAFWHWSFGWKQPNRKRYRVPKRSSIGPQTFSNDLLVATVLWLSCQSEKKLYEAKCVSQQCWIHSVHTGSTHDLLLRKDQRGPSSWSGRAPIHLSLMGAPVPIWLPPGSRHHWLSMASVRHQSHHLSCCHLLPPLVCLLAFPPKEKSRIYWNPPKRRTTRHWILGRLRLLQVIEAF